VSGLASGWILSNVFDDEAKYIIIVAGVSMLLAAASVFLVKENASETVSN
jgi:maltose/moltooligosaccharide transporter